MKTTDTATSLLQAFDFDENPVRAMLRDEDPWFVAADVCRVLELSHAPSAIRDLEDDEKATVRNEHSNPRAGVPHQMTVISESGLYALIFKSRKPEAKRFRKWVTNEVLPTLRRQGSYTAAEAEPLALTDLQKLRALLLSSAEAVRDNKLGVGPAQQVANLAARFLETIKIEGEATGYQNLLGLRAGETPARLLSQSRGEAHEQVQGLPQRGLPGEPETQPDLQEAAAPVQEGLAAAQPGQGEAPWEAVRHPCGIPTDSSDALPSD